MLIPRHWAVFRIEGRTPAGGKRVAMRYGWSDESPEAAQRHAEERAREAMRRIESGETGVAWRDRADAYGTETVPIREEVVARHGEDIVTRNAYGALCLNTPDVLFADVDLPVEKARIPVAMPLVTSCSLGLVAGLVTRGVPAAIVVALVSLPILFVLFHRMNERAARRHSPVVRESVLKRIRTRFESDAAALIRVYETPAGFRLAAEHALYAPGSHESAELFRSVETDVRFARLCRAQQCFRARLTAKPWRCGAKALNKSDVGSWPFTFGKNPALRARLIADYEKAASGYAACRSIAKFGRGEPHERATRVLDLHDELCRSRSKLPLA